ncbi:MAG: hypothetical protein M3133_07960 [Actinomycetota bacterium]|nr:hypothetical protein [Actinomycetota bacterium]
MEGAHWSPIPWVPTACATMGRLPSLHGALGTSTLPDTAVGAPVAVVERYKTRQALTEGS